MKTAIKSVVLGLVVLALGVIIQKALADMRKDPESLKLPEDVLRVDVMALHPETVQVTIPGFGPAKALDVVAIAPEVSGTVVEVHPNLDVGGIIPRGEAIFVIDPSSFEARLSEAKAQVVQLESQLERLKTQLVTDEKRLQTVERSRNLAEAEFERRKALLETDDVGSRSSVDAQEQVYNAAVDAADQLAQVVRVYPMRIAEAEAMLDSARARQDLAEIDLKRTKLLAPFTGRVTANSVEVGQFISPGRELVTLANDAILEISVPLSAEEARDWIRYTSEPAEAGSAWFAKVEPVECEVRWTDQVTRDQCWTGTLHRVGMYNEMSREINVVVRVTGEEAAPTEPGTLPLVDGMFCTVKIPGRTVENVYRVPDGLVSHEGTVYMAIDGRLHTVPVEVIHREGDEVLIRGDFDDGAELITTRLVNPLENMLLEVVREDEAPAE